MRTLTKIAVVLLALMIWLVHGLDIEYYTHVTEYNEAFDDNLKLVVASILFIMVLLLSSGTEDIYTKQENN